MANEELSQEISDLPMSPGTLVEITKPIFITNMEEYGFIVNHGGIRKKSPPNVVKAGTIGAIEKMAMFGLYSVTFCLRMRSDEFATIRLIVNKKDFKVPQAVVYNLQEFKDKRKRGNV